MRVRNADLQRGTSGSYRVIYYIADRDNILLVTVYSKTTQDGIDSAEIIRIINEADPS